MSPAIRRVVVGNTAAGEAVLVSDEQIAVVPRGTGHGIVGSEMWSTDAMPVDSSKAAEADQRQGFVKRFNHFNYVGNGQGTTFRITRWEPGHARFTHRTRTLDYDVVLEGEIDLELDGGETVHLKAGDVVVMRGARHTWMNRGDKTAVTAFMLIDATPVDSTSGPLAVEFPPPDD